MRGDETGVSYSELLIVMAIAALLCAITTPLIGRVVDAGRARHAAAFVAGRLRLARHQAVSTGRSAGLVFDEGANGWTFRVCVDGNGNGLRRAEIHSRVDACLEGPYALDQQFAGIRVAIDPGIPGPDGDPSGSDPVRFGVSNLVSFSPLGTCSAGTLFLQSPDRTQYALRLAGVTSRLRVLRYDPGGRRWNAV